MTAGGIVASILGTILRERHTIGELSQWQLFPEVRLNAA